MSLVWIFYEITTKSNLSRRFFIDIRLYNKARSVIEPFSFDKYRKDKIRQQIDATRPNRLQIKSNLPKVNQELALKYMDVDAKKKKGQTSLLADDRFKELFENPDYEIDKDATEYKLLTPVLSRLDKSKLKKLKQQAMETVVSDEENERSTDDDLFSERDGSSDDDDEDDRKLAQELKKQHKRVRKDNLKRQDESEEESTKVPKMIELPTQEFAVKSIGQKNYRLVCPVFEIRIIIIASIVFHSVFSFFQLKFRRSNSKGNKCTRWI